MVLSHIAENVNKNPKTTIGIVLFITFLMIAQLALNPQDGTISQSSFLPDNEVISALNDIGDKFSTEYPVDTLIYSNKNDILTSTVFVEILELEIAFTESPPSCISLLKVSAAIFTTVESSWDKLAAEISRKQRNGNRVLTFIFKTFDVATINL